MDDFSLNKALNKTISESRWGKRFLAISIKEDWAKIMGDTIAKYTRELSLKDQCLNITTDIAPLKNELSLNKKSIIDKINVFYKKEIVNTIEIH